MRVIQFKIEFRGLNLPISRTFTEWENALLHDLHKTIQWVLGYSGKHLYDFIIDETVFTRDEFQENFNSIVDTGSIKLIQFNFVEGDDFRYYYDYEDEWEFLLTVQKIYEADDETVCPHIVGAENGIPPENCGGVEVVNAVILNKIEEIESDNAEAIRSSIYAIPEIEKENESLLERKSEVITGLNNKNFFV